jgi:hypothetical protein
MPQRGLPTTWQDCGLCSDSRLPAEAFYILVARHESAKEFWSDLILQVLLDFRLPKTDGLPEQLLPVSTSAR